MRGTIFGFLYFTLFAGFIFALAEKALLIAALVMMVGIIAFIIHATLKQREYTQNTPRKE